MLNRNKFNINLTGAGTKGYFNVSSRTLRFLENPYNRAPIAFCALSYQVAHRVASGVYPSGARR